MKRDDASVSDDVLLTKLRNPRLALSLDAFREAGKNAFDAPGLYSWWVDELGAQDLRAGIGLRVDPGLIYAGLAGATRWPSGRPSTSTLWQRIAQLHSNGNYKSSTFRWTLGAILAFRDGVAELDESGLTAWMALHLRVIAVPYEDPDELGRLEKYILTELDPPLNLQGMPITPLRRRLKELRTAVAESR